MTTTAPSPRQGMDATAPAPRPEPRRHRLWLVDFYRSALGKKYVMAITGIVGLLFVLFHMIGNLKAYFGPVEYVKYAEFLREVGEPLAPRTVLLWIARLGLVASLVLHVHAAWSLTVVNRRARPVRYQSARHYVAADYAARTMRWTGVIVLLFIGWHLADLTWGWANPGFERGEVYDNLVLSLSRVPVAAWYVVANLALGLHIYHGGWSLFQTLGWNNRRFNHWRRYLAVGLAVVVVGGNLTFPLAVQFGILG